MSSSALLGEVKTAAEKAKKGKPCPSLPVLCSGRLPVVLASLHHLHRNFLQPHAHPQAWWLSCLDF